jgi:hypothetical protein
VPKLAPQGRSFDVALAAFVSLGGPLNIFGCFIVLRWNWAIQKSIERETDFRSPQVPVTHVLVRMCVANSVVSQLPLFFLLTKCTPMLGPGG